MKKLEHIVNNIIVAIIGATLIYLFLLLIEVVAEFIANFVGKAHIPGWVGFLLAFCVIFFFLYQFFGKEDRR